MDSPGGRLPATIEKVPPELLLVRMNPSYGCPTLAPGSTQTPLTRVPPLLSGEHTSMSVLAKAGLAIAMPTSIEPAATRTASVFFTARHLPGPPARPGDSAGGMR